MTTPFYQGLDPVPAPDVITPSEGDADRPDAISANEMGTAPYDISAPQDLGGFSAAFDASVRLAGEGSQRQALAHDLLESPQGFGAQDNLQGWYNTLPGMGAAPDGPIQGEPTGYDGTTQPGISQFTGGLGTGVDGIPPERGDMGPGSGVYPGTGQSGLPLYGTG